jgi:NADH-quinone oxidoreductase subunit L
MTVSCILLFPLFGAAILGLLAYFEGSHSSDKLKLNGAGFIGTTAIALAFVSAVFAFLNLRSGAGTVDQTMFTWISIGNLKIDFSLHLDHLSSLFALVITGVGTLIHLFSIGYMSSDATPFRYFAYLNLFCFMMLVLVLGSSLPVVFLGWEGVGLCSYLLIAYWYQDPKKALAGQKAFVMNRIGDVGFLLGAFLLYRIFGTFELSGIQEQALEITGPIVTVAACLIFLACTGKSAQFPLFTWLPDAMAGPTPVSALIHAATMVTSGIYLIARLSNVFLGSPVAMTVVVVVGLLTSIIAGTAALAQNDIKKVLAYSTVSQLGLMFMACGVGAFDTAVFHVVTHAFFKALLFLGAGSVIHALHEEQDITRMGGLRGKLPITFLTFAAAFLAIIGMPPFAGFFSKDEILWKLVSSEHGSWVYWIGGVVAAALTAVYMTRLFILTFMGKARMEKKVLSAAHEGPWTMTLPLLLLGVLSLVGGFLGIPHQSWIEHWLSLPNAGSVLSGSIEWIFMVGSVLSAVGFSYLGYLWVKKGPEEKNSQFLRNAWSIDTFYSHRIVSGIFRVARSLDRFVEGPVVNGSVRSIAGAAQLSGGVLRMLSSGSLQSYSVLFLLALGVALGVIGYDWIN